MVRSAAKNHAGRDRLRPGRLAMRVLPDRGARRGDDRHTPQLAAKAYAHTAAYDAAISAPCPALRARPRAAVKDGASYRDT